MKHGARVGLSVVLAGLVCAGVGEAAKAKPKPKPVPAPTSIANLRDTYAKVSSFVDREGTVHVAWYDENSSYTVETLRYARKTAKAKKFTIISIPGAPNGVTSAPYIYQPSAGVLRMIANVEFTIYAWQSTNDGVTWTEMNTSALSALSSGSLYLSSALSDAPGGPIEYAGDDGAGGPIVQLNSTLTGVTTIGTGFNGIVTNGVARAGDGTVFALGVSGSGSGPSFAYTAGAKTGTISFPCSELGAGQPEITGAAHGAVVVAAGCGRAWERTISSAGALGALKTLGVVPNPSKTTRPSSVDAAISLVARAGGGFTVGFTDPSGDLHVATSTTGANWTVAKKLVPDSNAFALAEGGVVGQLARGAATWFGYSTATSTNNTHAVRAIALASAYTPPAHPSTKGLLGGKGAVLGSLGVAAPGKVAPGPFRKTYRASITVRLVSAIPDRVAIDITISRSLGGGSILDLASGYVPAAPIKAGQTRTLKIPVLAEELPKSGDLVTYTFSGRTGTITLTGKVD
jgi:hypothetical protein